MKSALAALVALSALTWGCAHAPSAPICVEAPMISAEAAARAVATTTTSGEPRRSRATAATGEMPFQRGDRLSGHYMCSQGRTELTLVVEDVDGDDVSAIFEFDYAGGGGGAGGSHAPAGGSFRMHGAFDARSRALRLDGDRWLEQPDGYAMVGLVGTVSSTGSVSGTVKGAGCTSFYVAGPRHGAQKASAAAY
jgi:hypothetical protein